MYIVTDGDFSKIYSSLTDLAIAQFAQMHCAVLRIDTFNATDVIRVYEVDESGNETQLKETPR